jgi:hypothetical protein
MIYNHQNLWLLRPGVSGFSSLPELFDDTDIRPGAEQLGEHWQPIEEKWRLEGSALRGRGRGFELLGAIRLLRELVLIFNGNLVAIVQSDRSFAVAQLEFEVSWIGSIEPPPAEHPEQTTRTQRYSYQPEVFFKHAWHNSGNRFATKAEAEAFVANLRASWISQGFIKRDRVEIVREAPNVFLIWKTKQAERLPDDGTEPNAEGRAA